MAARCLVDTGRPDLVLASRAGKQLTNLVALYLVRGEVRKVENRNSH